MKDSQDGEQDLLEALDRINKIIRMETGCAQGSGWQISHPVSLQASLRAAGCLLASSAARTTLSTNAEEQTPRFVTQDSDKSE